MEALEEPVTPKTRALLYELATWENNIDRYFDTHRGSRAGLWWQNPWTSCHCPMHGYLLSFLYWSNFLGEPRTFEKAFLPGYLTFQRYVDPIEDKRKLLPALPGPNGEPERWLLAGLTRHPLEKSTYQWGEWIAKMNGPLSGNEDEAVDKLMALEGLKYTGPLRGGADWFVTGVAVPVALALGWYDPDAAGVTQDELPPTTVFNVEGWVPMRSGWDSSATELQFVCGARDHTCRHQANHFTIAKGGEFLFGTPSLWYDDGNPTPAWGNVVVPGEDWLQRWQLNLQHPRDREYTLIDRFSPATFGYLNRDRALTGYSPAEGGWGGGLDMHGHTETLFTRGGQLLGYETWPELDYVAGDATNAWTCDDARHMFRQVVFLKPDTVVVYDRVSLGAKAGTSRWLACTGPTLATSGAGFTVKSGAMGLQGQVLLPDRAELATPKPFACFVWKDQKVLEIRPAEQQREVEYLVVLRVGDEKVAAPAAELVREGDLVGVRLQVGDKEARVLFARSGPLTGRIEWGGKTYSLEEQIKDTYANWRADPRYQKWTTEKRFDFVIPKGDR
jgi:hypothetical protein